MIPEWLKDKLTEEDVSKISLEIEKAEKLTQAEIVPMIVKESSYSFRKEMAMIFIFVIVSFVYLTPLQSFGAILLFSTIARSLMRIIPQMVKKRAIQEFYESNIHSTLDGTGVLLFVSMKEKQVEVIVDKQTDTDVPQDFWDNIVSVMTSSLGQKDITTAYVDGINMLGKELSKIYPVNEENPNEISNNIIIKE